MGLLMKLVRVTEVEGVIPLGLELFDNSSSDLINNNNLYFRQSYFGSFPFVVP